MKSPSLTVRPYRIADQARCAAIYVAARRVAFAWVPADRFSLEDFLADTADEEISVAEGRLRGGNVGILGFVSVFARDRFIHHLYVDPDCRRHGIGRALMRYATASQPGPWRLKCVVANEAAMAFYRAEGWVEERRGRDSLGPYAALRRD